MIKVTQKINNEIKVTQNPNLIKFRVLFVFEILAFSRSKHIANNKKELIVIVNPTAVYGPRDKDFLFLLKTIAKKLELYIGRHEQMLSFVHVHDLVQGIFLAMELNVFNKNLIISDLKNYSSITFNNIVKQSLKVKTIIVKVPVSVATVFAVFSEVMGNIRGITPVLNRERLKEFKAKNWTVDASEIENLGFKPKYDLQNGIPETIKWYKENGWLTLKK